MGKIYEGNFDQNGPSYNGNNSTANLEKNATYFGFSKSYFVLFN